jgi:hypothetical protein
MVGQDRTSLRAGVLELLALMCAEEGRFEVALSMMNGREGRLRLGLCPPRLRTTRYGGEMMRRAS